MEKTISVFTRGDYIPLFDLAVKTGVNRSKVSLGKLLQQDTIDNTHVSIKVLIGDCARFEIYMTGDIMYSCSIIIINHFQKEISVKQSR